MNERMLGVLSFPGHLKVGDNVMVSPISARFEHAGKVAKNIFRKIYGTILEYPLEGPQAGKVLAMFVLNENKDGIREEVTWWFDVEDLFVRPVVSSIFT